MTEAGLIQEKAYLRQRNVQLQDDIVAVTAEVERLHGRAPTRPNPLSGGR